jgi:hypothetical protein
MFDGGGEFDATLNNCTLTGNSSGYTGGGAAYGTLVNCTLFANTAPSYGGGAAYSYLRSCILFLNTARVGANYFEGTQDYCCAAPLPPSGAGNINKAPRFVDQAGGNLRLQTNSPCINVGNNDYVTGAIDRDGRPRIVGTNVDMGAYESQGGSLGAFISWLQQYGLPTDGSADYADSDHDGMNNWQEWVAGTDPTNAASLLRITPLVVTPPGLLLRWNSDASHDYFIERAIGFGSPPAFSLLQTNVSGQAGTTIFTDTTAPGIGAVFYRVGTSSGGVSIPLSLEVPQVVPANVTITWTSVTNRRYSVERSASLLAPMLFAPVATNVPGQAGMTIFTDTNASGSGPFWYRVGVQ